MPCPGTGSTVAVPAAGDNGTAIPPTLMTEPPSATPAEPPGSPLLTFPLPPLGGKRDPPHRGAAGRVQAEPGAVSPPVPPAPCPLSRQMPATARWAPPPCRTAASPPPRRRQGPPHTLPACTAATPGRTCGDGPPRTTPTRRCSPTPPSCSWTCWNPPTSPVSAHLDPPRCRQWRGVAVMGWVTGWVAAPTRVAVSPGRGGGAGSRFL